MPCTWPCTSRYDPVHVFSSPTNRPRSKQWPRAGILLWRSRPPGGPCPACQGRDTRLSALPRLVYGLGAGECRPYPVVHLPAFLAEAQVDVGPTMVGG